MLITLATSVRNDFQGLFFTINSALLATKGTYLEGNLEIVVVNDSDNSEARGYIESICRQHGVRCQTVDFRSNHAGRNAAVKMSRTPYTVLCDSHVLFQHGFFQVYLEYLEELTHVGLIHSPFTCGGTPSFRGNCFYNMAKFDRNLHGSFSHRGALPVGLYPVALAPHAAYGFRTAEWLEIGGYIDSCVGNGGGEPYVSLKYWMFGKEIHLTPDTGFIHMDTPQYSKVRGHWKRNHAITAAALAGPDTGRYYAGRLGCIDDWEIIWQAAEPYYNFVKSKTVIPFNNLLDHWKTIQARPFV